MSEDACAISLPARAHADFPLSKAEKLHRLVQLFEREIQDRDEDNHRLRVELDSALKECAAAKVNDIAARQAPLRHCSEVGVRVVEVDLHGVSGVGGLPCSLRGAAGDVATIMDFMRRGGKRPSQPRRFSVTQQEEEAAFTSASSSQSASSPPTSPRRQTTGIGSPTLPVSVSKPQGEEAMTGITLNCGRVVPGLNLCSLTPPTPQRVFSIRTPPHATPRGAAGTPRVFSLTRPGDAAFVATPRAAARVWSLVTPRGLGFRGRGVFNDLGEQLAQPRLVHSTDVGAMEGRSLSGGLHEVREHKWAEEQFKVDVADSDHAAREGTGTLRELRRRASLLTDGSRSFSKDHRSSSHLREGAVRNRREVKLVHSHSWPQELEEDDDAHNEGDYEARDAEDEDDMEHSGEELVKAALDQYRLLDERDELEKVMALDELEQFRAATEAADAAAISAGSGAAVSGASRVAQAYIARSALLATLLGEQSSSVLTTLRQVATVAAAKAAAAAAAVAEWEQAGAAALDVVTLVERRDAPAANSIRYARKGSRPWRVQDRTRLAPAAAVVDNSAAIGTGRRGSTCYNSYSGGAASRA